MGKISILNQSVAELIAAGEIIERPASIVKELVENSIDAGARCITIEIKDGGVSYIRVSDDGHGIDPDDIKIAFVRHATSKIYCAADLESIYSLGFRGEALASIAAVTKVELISKIRGDKMGHKLVFNNNEPLITECGSSNGTTIIAKDLFYNVPARLKFLKKNSTESNVIYSVIDRLALAYPMISFNFIKDGKTALSTPGNNDLITSIYYVLGKEISQNMIEVKYELNELKVTGYITKPNFTRSNNKMQYFFVNNRPIKCKLFSSAIEEGFSNKILTGRYCHCVINLILDASKFDINVHPSKMEVKFQSENKVYEVIYLSIKTVLDNYSKDILDICDDKLTIKDVKDLDQSKSTKTDFSFKLEEDPLQLNLNDKNCTVSPTLDNNMQVCVGDVGYGFNNTQVADNFISNLEASPKGNYLSKNITQSNMTGLSNEKLSINNNQNQNDYKIIKNYNIIGELFKTYILLEYKNQLVLIDKHAAHERIIFNKLSNDMTGIEKQLLISPINISLIKNEYSIAIESIDLFSKLGFTIEDFGIGSIIVSECPMIISKESVRDIVIGIIDDIKDYKKNISLEVLRHKLSSVACRSAIKANDKNNISELKNLVDLIINDPNVRYCPHGRPIFVNLSKTKIEKLFGRLI